MQHLSLPCAVLCLCWWQLENCWFVSAINETQNRSDRHTNCRAPFHSCFLLTTFHNSWPEEETPVRKQCVLFCARWQWCASSLAGRKARAFLEASSRPEGEEETATWKGFCDLLSGHLWCTSESGHGAAWKGSQCSGLWGGEHLGVSRNSIQLLYLRAWQQPDKANYSQELIIIIIIIILPMSV
jgi:hypothetical protein